MAWKRGNPGCPCCTAEPPTCGCPNGGVSRKFAGTPTVIVTIEDLPSTITFQTLYQTGLIAQNFWTTVTIDDLDAYNGTYSWTLNKNEQGCILYDSSNSVRSSTLAEYQLSLTRRLRQGFNNCTLVGSPEAIARSPVASLLSSIVSSPYQDTFQVQFTTEGWHSTGAFGDARLYEITGRQRLICSKDYDPLEDEEPSGMGAGIQELEFYPKDQNIYLIYAADVAGRCVSPELRVLHQIGKIYAEIIDDVP